MLLKPLEYRIFRNGQPDILFSTGTCAIFQADPLSLSILDFLREHGASEREQITGALSGRYSESEIESTLSELEQAGFLLSSAEVDNGSEIDAKPPHAPLPGASHFVLNVSHACNLKCSYCYAEGGNYNGKTQLMSPEMAASLAAFLLETTSDYEVQITFFGGEPLLNTDAIKAAVTRGRQRASELGKKINFSITTNGTLYDEEFISYAISNGLKFTVSIDGLRDGHDKHRKFNDGKGSYDTIVSCLPKILDKVAVPARTTLTKDNPDVVSIIDHLLNLGFSEVGFAPVDVADGGLALGERELEQVLDAFTTLSDRFMSDASESRVYGFSNMINLIKLFHEGEARPLPCGAGIKLMGVSPNGDFYLCHRFTGNEEFRIGSIQDGFDDGKRREILEAAHVDSKTSCSSCWARHLCGGGCYYLSNLHHGNIKDPHHLTCSFLLRWYEMGMRIYANIASSNPDFVEKCSGSRLSC
jgi:uncharacterized protein